MKIVEKMLNRADLNYKRFNENLVKGNSPFIGIRIPELRKLAKEIIKNNQVADFFDNYEGIFFEEKLIKGLLLSSNEELFKKYVFEYLKTLDSWCLVDTFCNSCKFINNKKDKYWNFVKDLIDSNEEFIKRCGYVFLLNYYLEDKYINEVLEFLLKKSDFYYVNMAIAWCISEAFIKYPEDIEEILKEKKLDEFVQNKAIDKINDSYRVDGITKVRLRDLKYF